MVNLTADDVRALARDPSAANRANTAAKIAADFNDAGAKDRPFTAAELQLAEDILRLMARDAEVRVREALSANLKNNPRLPHDVAVALARDVDSVALPILSLSDVLTSEDLVQIITSQGAQNRLEAIAGRRQVAAEVSAAIVERGSESVVAQLLANPGADLSEPTLHRVVDKFGDSEAIQEPMIYRDLLPVTVAERLVTRVADHLRTHLLAKHRISPEVATDLVLHSRERATVGLAMGVSEEALASLVRQLQDKQRLSPSLVLRWICMGNLRFFEHALAALAGIPVGNGRLLIHDQGGLGFKTIWARASLPGSFFPAVRAALDVVDQTEMDGRVLDPERYSRRIVERLLTQYESNGINFANDDLEYLLARVAGFPPVSLALH